MRCSPVQAVMRLARSAAACSCADQWLDVLRRRTRTAALQRLLLQLFAARCCLAEGLSSLQALRELCERNGIEVSSDGACQEPAAAGGDTEHASGGKHKATRVSNHGEKKGKKDKRARKRRRRAGSDDGSDLDAGLEADEALHGLQLRSGQYKARCSLKDAAECLHLLASIGRISAWQTSFRT